MLKKLYLPAITCLTLIYNPIQAQQIPAQDITLSQYKYPFPVHLLSLHIQGQPLRMAYMDVQPAKPNGKTIVLLHGNNFCGAYRDSTAADLSKTVLGKANVPEEVRKTMGNYPELGNNAAKKIPHATLVPIPGVGHLPHIEAYAQFIAPLLQFLQE